MKKTLLCLGSVFLVSGIVKAQKNVIKVNDSVKQGRLDEVIITATRTPEIIKKQHQQYTLSTVKKLKNKLQFLRTLVISLLIRFPD